MIKVSVVVPVYNVEAYLAKCLDSLVNQTLQQMEIIVVNDGATDNSQKIIDEYAAKYPQIKAYQKKNGGLSDARNFGMQYVTGEYVGFVDSDDYVDAEMYQVLYEKASETGADIVECNLHHTYPDYEDTEVGEKIQDRKEMIMNGRSVVWNKLYKKDWLVGTGVPFPTGMIYEDVNFFVKVVPFIRKYEYVDGAYVHYVQRSTSINNMSSKKTLDIIRVLSDITEFYKKNGFYEEYKDALEYLYTRILLCSSFARMTRIGDKRERKDALRQNYALLTDTFPNWKKNPYLATNKSKRGMFMKTINGFTYRCYGAILPVFHWLKGKLGKQQWG